ncbi:Putative MYB DNA-binding domain protein [Penicillium brasilianum]|uniref:Putative MYB DNA-binding domain protein n=1 Tax=Penicillium brasilianum TaxID=104259 RepID=A0A0F7TK23_PENBI|nr:Putative MYB DNA-binding domain protein [Penicillium brasilianum]
MSSPPNSKRIKTSATTSAPPHLLAQQQLHPFHRVPTFDGIPIPTAPIPHSQQQQPPQQQHQQHQQHQQQQQQQQVVQQQQQQQQHQQSQQQASSRKRPQSPTVGSSTMMAAQMSSTGGPVEGDPTALPPAPEPAPKKKGRTNTPWTAEEEQRLKTMRDAGRSWSEIAKTFPTRTEGSVKKHWYKDMHYAEFAEDESIKLRDAIKEYEANKWKVIGQKVGKPAKACEQYAKEHFKNL